MVRSMSTRGVTEVQVPISMGKGKQRFGKYRAGSAPTSVPRISNGSGSGSTGTVSTVKDDQSVFSYKQQSVVGDGDDFSVYDSMSVYDMSVVDGASCFAGGDSVMGESLFDEQSMYHDNTVYGDEHSLEQHIDHDEELPMEDTTGTPSIPTNILLEDNSTNRNQHPQISMNDESHTSFSHSHSQLDHEDDVHDHNDTPTAPTTIATNASTTPTPKTTKPVPILRNKNKNTNKTNANTNTVVSVAPTDESSYETPSPESTPKRMATTSTSARPSIADGKKQKSTLWTSFKLSTKKPKNGKKSLFTKLFKRTKAEF